MTTKQKSFFKGALILTIAGVLGRMLGALYRIPFNRIVGEEGAALYGLSYSLYSLLFALSTAGIPLAVSYSPRQTGSRAPWSTNRQRRSACARSHRRCFSAV